MDLFANCKKTSLWKFFNNRYHLLCYFVTLTTQEICGKNDSGPTQSSRSSTLSDGVTPTELNDLKLELQATNARIRVLEEQVAFLMNYFQGQIPPIFNQVRIVIMDI